MKINDYDDVINLWKKSSGIGLSDADSRDNIAKFLTRNRDLCFVCQIDEKIIGTILCGHDGRRGYIYHTFVDENYRRKGIGEKLVSLTLGRLKLSGIDKCHIYVYNDNELGKKFWEKISWEKRDLIMYSKYT